MKQFIGKCIMQSNLISLIRKKSTNKILIFSCFIFFPIWAFKYFYKSVICIKDKEKYEYNLCAVLIAKNEGPYIREWIEFHKNLGFDKFIIYDNESSDELNAILSPYINSKLVDYYFYPGKCRQNYAYNDAIKKYRDKCELMIMIDADEFLYPTNYNDSIYNIVKNIMNQNSRVGGVIVNWLCYGSNEHISKPNGLVIENYTKRGYETFSHNLNFKTIVNPRKVSCYTTPHYAIYKRKFFAVNTAMKRIDICPMSNVNDMDFSMLRLNHYFTKSKEEFIAKRSRGMADNCGIRPFEDFLAHDVNDVEDDCLIRYVDIIKNKIEENS